MVSYDANVNSRLAFYLACRQPFFVTKQKNPLDCAGLRESSKCVGVLNSRK